MDHMPIARTVKHRGVAVVLRGQPWRVRANAAIEALGDGPRSFIAAVIGLWPVTATFAVGVLMCWAAVLGNGP